MEKYLVDMPYLRPLCPRMRRQKGNYIQVTLGHKMLISGVVQVLFYFEKGVYGMIIHVLGQIILTLLDGTF